MSADPSIPELFPGSADIGWPMSDEVICTSADPSIMELMAEHYVSVGAVFKEVMYVDTLVRDPISHELPSLTKACFPVPVSQLWSVSPFSSFAHTL